MELHNLKPASGAVKKEKRIGRGQGSGHGGTSTRGHKGDKARSGSRLKRAFEGGQTPMQRRLPKRGFKNINRVEYIPLNLGKLESLVQKTGVTTLDMPFLLEQGIAKSGDVIKILGTGSLTSKISVSAHAISAAAKAAIEAIGGSVTIVTTYTTASTQE